MYALRPLDRNGVVGIDIITESPETDDPVFGYVGSLMLSYLRLFRCGLELIWARRLRFFEAALASFAMRPGCSLA